jgi:hypothetical protein
MPNPPLWLRGPYAADRVLVQAGGWRSGKASKASGSFLKKRTKKLFPVFHLPQATGWAPRGKSFLDLFFKK